MHYMKTEKSCGCIILKDDKVLLIGAKDDEGKLFWSFPKGHQKIGETDIETAVRETKEETGLDVEVIDTNPIKTGHLRHGGTVYKEILLFIAEPLSEKLKLQEDEVEQIRWVQITEAGKYFTDYRYYGEVWEEFLKKFYKP